MVFRICISHIRIRAVLQLVQLWPWVEQLSGESFHSWKICCNYFISFLLIANTNILVWFLIFKILLPHRTVKLNFLIRTPFEKWIALNSGFVYTLESDLFEVSACRIMILKVCFFGTPCSVCTMYIYDIESDLRKGNQHKIFQHFQFVLMSLYRPKAVTCSEDLKSALKWKFLCQVLFKFSSCCF